MLVTTPECDVAVLRRKLIRERSAREEAEALLDTRAVELRARTVWLEEATDRLRANELYLRAVLDAAQEAILTFDEAGCIHDANVSCEALFRFKSDQMRGLNLDRLIPDLESKLPELTREARHLASGGHLLRRQGFARTAGTDVLAIHMTVRPVDSAADTQSLFVALVSDRSREEALQARLDELLAREPMPGSGPWNDDPFMSSSRRLREWFDERLYEMRLGDLPCHTAVLCCDVDRFKRVNENLGFEAGDAVIAALVSRIRECVAVLTPAVEARVAFCRLFADQFVMAVVAPTPLDALESWALALRQSLGEPLETYAQRFVFSFSVGAAVSTVNRPHFPSLLAEADVAMRRAKLHGGNGYCLYCQSLDAGRPNLLTIEHNVILGIERGEFKPFFQPKVCAASGQILGFEALLRWQHPDRGLIPLGEFLPVLENSSLMLDVGLQVFKQVVSTLAEWQALGFSGSISFNLSNAEVLSASYRKSLRTLVRQAGVKPSQICLEITETVMANLGTTGDEIFTALLKDGFRLSMDDFGVGTSSLWRLRSIPLHEIKIDRAFMRGIEYSDVRDTQLLSGIVNIARGLGLDVVVEGVETKHQLNVARTMGHLTIQGFYFSPAVDAAQALEMIKKRAFEESPCISQTGSERGA